MSDTLTVDSRPFRPWWRRGALGRFLSNEHRLLACIAIAVALHLPAMPFSRIFASLFDSDDESEEAGEAIAPIELEIDVDLEEQPKLAIPPDPVEAPAPPPSTTDEAPEIAPPRDAGPPDAQPDAPPDAPPDAEPPPPDAEAPKPKDEEPIDRVPIVRTLTKNPNNVQIFLVGSKLRAHPVGVKMGPLLAMNPQWKSFFDNTGIDPIQDIDFMVLTGPMMRVSGQVVAYMQFSGDMARVDKAVGSLLDKSDPKGEWIPDMPVKAARGMADVNERLFAIKPKEKMLAVIPSPYPSAREQKKLAKKNELDAVLAKADKMAKAQFEAFSKSKPTDLSKADFAIDATMREPWKLFGKDGTVEVPVMGEVEVIPKTIKHGRVSVVPEGGGAKVTLTLLSSDEKQAAEDAKSLASIWPFAKMGAKAKFGIDLPDLTFEVKGNVITGKIDVSEAFLNAVFKLGEELTEKARKQGEGKKSRKRK